MSNSDLRRRLNQLLTLSETARVGIERRPRWFGDPPIMVPEELDEAILVLKHMIDFELQAQP